MPEDSAPFEEDLRLGKERRGDGEKMMGERKKGTQSNGSLKEDRDALGLTHANILAESNRSFPKRIRTIPQRVCHT